MIKGSFVAVALFVATTLTAETTISSPPSGPTPAGVNKVGLAPLGDGFVGVWTEGSDCASLELRGMRFDRQLRTLDARSFLVAAAPASTAIIGTATDGGAAYVAWQAPKNLNELTVHLTRINPDATVTAVSDSVPVAGTPVALRISHGYFVFLASDRAHHGALTATLLDRNGAVVRSAVAVIDPAATVFDSDIVATDGTLVIAWIGDDRRVHATGVLVADIAANRVPLVPVQSLPAGSAGVLRLASDGTHTIAFWYEASVQELRARSLDTAGNPFSAGPVTVGSFRPQDAVLALATNNGYRFFFFEWNNGTYQLVSLRIGFDGSLQSTARSAPLTSGFAIAVAQNGEGTIAVRTEHRYAAKNYTAGVEAVVSTVAADGNFGPGTLLSIGLPVQHVRKLLPFGGGAAALWTESAPNDRLAVGRLSASGKPIDGAGLRLFDSPYDQTGGAIATDGERLAVVWTEGDQSKPQPLYAAIVTFPDSPAASVRRLATDVEPYGDTGISWNGAAYVITWRRALPNNKYEFAALRIDPSGNPIDPAPISLMPAHASDVRPRLVSNGSDYLLLWERWYDPFVYISLAPPCQSHQPLPNELFAQRFSAALTPVGAPIALATTTNYDDYLFDAQGDDISFGGGVWLISWVDKKSGNLAFTRVDASGQRLDPLNGRNLFYSCGSSFLVPAPGGWMIASQVVCSWGGLGFVRVAADGTSTAPAYDARSGDSLLEAFTLAPLPMLAYKRRGSPAAYIEVLPQRPRAVRH